MLASGLPFKTALVVGGDAMPQQLHRIKQGVELIIGTPGRLIDLLSKHDCLNLQVLYIVLAVQFFVFVDAFKMSSLNSERTRSINIADSLSMYDQFSSHGFRFGLDFWNSSRS